MSLSACSTVPKIVTEHKVSVELPPKALVEPKCSKSVRTIGTTGELVEAYLARDEELDACAARFDAVGSWRASREPAVQP